ncbi:MAG: polysaccharide deacetylase family protein [Chloroflexi bacterium]|nr:polysaccharide deacetylase family protein [Chloroflexota bacterium]
MAGPAGRTVPVLMYHYIRVVDRQRDPLGYGLSVAPTRFAEQMAWLRASGYTTLTMGDHVACARGARSCPARSVVLTFDDGYADNAIEALPVLQRYGFTATFYIVSGFVGRPGYLTWAQLEQVRDAGMEIGAHTVNHRDLTAVTPAVARDEIVRSRQTLRERLGVPVASIAYPAGRYTPATIELVRQAGYESAVTTRPGRLHQQPYETPRLRVLGGVSLTEFAALVAGPG